MGGKTDEKRMRFQIGSFVNKQHKFSNDVTLLTLPYLTQVALQSLTPTSITNKHRPFDILFFSCFLVDAIFPLYMLLSTDQIGIMFFPSSISRLVGHFFFFSFVFSGLVVRIWLPISVANIRFIFGVCFCYNVFSLGLLVTSKVYSLARAPHSLNRFTRSLYSQVCSLT